MSVVHDTLQSKKDKAPLTSHESKRAGRKEEEDRDY